MFYFWRFYLGFRIHKLCSFAKFHDEQNIRITKFCWSQRPQHPYQPLLERTVGFSISVQYWNVSTGGHAVYYHVQLWRHSHSQHWGQLRVSVADQPTEQTGANKGTAWQHRWHDSPSGLELPKVSLMEKDSSFELNWLLLGVQDLMFIMCLCLKGTWVKVGQWNILLTSTPSVCHQRTQSERTWPRCFWATGRILCKFCDYLGGKKISVILDTHLMFIFFLTKKKNCEGHKWW